MHNIAIYYQINSTEIMKDLFVAKFDGTIFLVLKKKLILL